MVRVSARVRVWIRVRIKSTAGAMVRVWYLAFPLISISHSVMFIFLSLLVLEIGLRLWLALGFC